MPHERKPKHQHLDTSAPDPPASDEEQEDVKPRVPSASAQKRSKPASRSSASASAPASRNPSGASGNDDSLMDEYFPEPSTYPDPDQSDDADYAEDGDDGDDAEWTGGGGSARKRRKSGGSGKKATVKKERKAGGGGSGLWTGAEDWVLFSALHPKSRADWASISRALDGKRDQKSCQNHYPGFMKKLEAAIKEGRI